MILSGLLQAIHGAEKGERAALLLSPSCSIPTATGISSHHSIGSLFTIFLTAPLHAFLFLLGISGSDIEMVRPESSTGLCAEVSSVLLMKGKFLGNI